MKRHPLTQALASAALSLSAALLATGSAQAGLIGDTVTAELVDFAGAGGVSTQFAASAVVGAGTEFTGIWNYTPLSQVWQVVLDVDDSGFTVTFTDIGGGSNHDLSGFTFLGLRLGDLDAGSPIIGATVLASDGAAVQSIGTSARGVTVQWNAFQFRDAAGGALTGGSSLFAIQTIPVSEPGTAGLLLAGLFALAGVARRGQQRAA